MILDANLIYSCSAAVSNNKIWTTCCCRILLQSILNQLIFKIVNLEKLEYFPKGSPWYSSVINVASCLCPPRQIHWFARNVFQQNHLTSKKKMLSLSMLYTCRSWKSANNRRLMSLTFLCLSFSSQEVGSPHSSAVLGISSQPYQNYLSHHLCPLSFSNIPFQYSGWLKEGFPDGLCLSSWSELINRSVLNHLLNSCAATGCF